MLFAVDFMVAKVLNSRYPRIVFHHIPKCGDASVVRGIALTYYPMILLRKGKTGFSGGLDMRAAQFADELFSVDRFQFCRMILAYQLARGASPLVYGHYPFSRKVYDRFKGHWSFVTILRNPVDRWYSHFFYNRL